MNTMHVSSVHVSQGLYLGIGTQGEALARLTADGGK